jgi:hypothetical protein
MKDPTARSPAERRLEGIHDEERDVLTGSDVVDAEVEAERAYASILADHRAVTMDTAEILASVDYDLDELRAAARDLYPGRFGGDVADA